MKFTLEIKMGNEAMQTGSDAHWAIGQSLAKFMGEELRIGYNNRIRDENGNTVGHWEIEE